MSPSLPRRTDFSASLTGFPMWEMSLRVFSAHRCDGNIIKSLTNMKLLSLHQITLTHLLCTFMNAWTDEGQSEEVAAGAQVEEGNWPLSGTISLSPPPQKLVASVGECWNYS